MTLPADDRPHRAADDSEEIYFQGSPLLRGELGRVLLWALAGAVLLAVAAANHLRWHVDVPWWVYLAVVLAGVLLPLVPLVTRRAVRYRITNYRIDQTYGLLSRNTDTVELWHVEDLRLHQSLLNRLVGVGTITVLSRDEVIPSLVLTGLPRPVQLFQHLEQRVIAVKRQRGVMKVDPG